MTAKRKLCRAMPTVNLLVKLLVLMKVTPEVLLKATQFVSMTLVRDKKVIKEVKHC